MTGINEFLKSRTASSLRIIFQVVFFVLFSLSLVVSTTSQVALLFVEAVLNSNPLFAISNLLSGKALSFALVYAAAFLTLVFLFGRFWCGWLCPLGTILEVFPKFKLTLRMPSWLRRVKIAFMIAILILSAAETQFLMIFDPLAVFIRTFAVVVWPIIFYGFNAFNWLIYKVPFLEAIWSGISYSLNLPDAFSIGPSLFGFWIFLLTFFAIYSLNIFESRFWCRNLCPLGGLLAFFSKFSIFKLRAREGCNGCLTCANVCPVGAIKFDAGMKIDFGECILCLKCINKCRKGEIEFSAISTKKEGAGEFLPERRAFLDALGISLFSLALFNAEKRSVKADLIRPPGATEESLKQNCMRCGACIRACPTGAIQPSFFEAGVEMLFTPVLVLRRGYCDYNCTRCGIICPHGAIKELQLEKKQRTSIGKAVINRKKCLPWSQGKSCIVCEEACPVPNKAIKLEERSYINKDGELKIVQVPVVHICRCIGCGVCESKCPVEGTSAIRVLREEFVDHTCSRKQNRAK